MKKTDVTPNAALSSAEIEARIQNERQRLLAEQKMERELSDQRLAPLEAGDDDALDQVEAQINACRDRQFRIQERIEILETRVETARENEQSATLDKIAEQAERARFVGESLIRSEYKNLALGLREFLIKISLLQEFITRSNKTLVEGDRSSVPGVETFRDEAETSETAIEAVRVEPYDERHPRCREYFSLKEQLASCPGTSRATQLRAQLQAITPEDIRVSRQIVNLGRSAERLIDEVRLPGLKALEERFWSESDAQHFEYRGYDQNLVLTLLEPKKASLK